MAPIKPIVNSWDVFDTLLTRFVLNPLQVFALIDRRHPGVDFQARRLGAQAALDKIGKPYVIHDIYRHMRGQNLPPETARALLIEELATERTLMLPVRSAVQQVTPSDLIISDMYLAAEFIGALLADICDLHTIFPIIRSNWGKHTGTIWPKILEQYVIRTHYGDNPSSDGSVPQKFGINTVLLRDVDPSPWEKFLLQSGLEQRALIQREVRLRSLHANAFEHLATGPYLSLLLGYAGFLHGEFGETAVFGFLSRDCDDLARIFRALYPAVRTFNIDLSRRLIQQAGTDAIFNAEIPANCILVDGVSTGRSVKSLLERIGPADRVLHTLLLLDHLLEPAETEAFPGTRLHRSSAFGGRHYPLELLLQSPYPPVTAVLADPASGGLIHRFGPTETTAAEAALIASKSEIVTNLIRVIQQRGLPALTQPQNRSLMQASLEAILTSELYASAFPSFIAQEKSAPFSAPTRPQTTHSTSP